MKFMKLGSKLDTFQTHEDGVRIAVTDYATDFIVDVRDVKFYLHKFPLLSRCYRLQKLCSNTDEIQISDIPGGPVAFELCAKFCYGMTVTLNAHNVIATRCAAGYLEMYQTIDTGNLISKVDAFLDTSIFHSWKDSIIALQTTKSLIPRSEDLKLASRCIDSIASKASIDPSRVDWSYAYDRKKLQSENVFELQLNGIIKQQVVPADWWVEDLCELEIDLYKRVITTIKSLGKVSPEVIGEALKSYTYKRIPGFIKGAMDHGGDATKTQTLLETIVWLLPLDVGSVPFSFLLKINRVASLLDCGEMCKKEIIKQLGHQLEKASVSDLLSPGVAGDNALYDINTVRSIVEEFLMQDSGDAPYFVPDSSKMVITKLVDGYLGEIAKDPNLALSEFIDFAEMVSGDSRPVHDNLYRAIDIYMKEHREMSKSERKRISVLLDCRRLSAECREHAVQNEFLPTRTLVQILLCTCSSGSSQLIAPAIVKHNSNMVSKVEDLKSLKLAGGGVESYRSTSSSSNSWSNQIADDKGNGKVRVLFGPKNMLSKLWSGESSSDTSNSSGMANPS